MFKLTLRLFVLIFVARSVTSLECYRTNEAECGSKTDRKDLAKCLSNKYEKFKCDKPKDKGCVKGHIIGNDGVRIDLRGCISVKSESKDVCEKELFEPMAGTGFPRSSRKDTKCVVCDKDNCNVAASYKNVSYIIFFACWVLAIVFSF